MTCMVTNLPRLIKGATALAFAITVTTSAYAHSGHKADDADIQTKELVDVAEHDRARSYFSDTVLKTHTGEDVRFYSDVLEGHTVVISFIFTSCEDACPLINKQLEMVQKEIGARMGDDIRFVSISVDPENDTPEVLSEYRQRFNASPGWIFLTGDAEAVDTVGEKLGQVFEREAHLTGLLVGNTNTARWRKIPSYLPPNVISAQVLDIAG